MCNKLCLATALVAASLIGTALAQDRMPEGRMPDKPQAGMKDGMKEGMDDPMMGMIMYEVTIENTTKGQPLSPPLLTTHDPSVFIFKKGESASDSLRKLAEEGHNKALANELEEAKDKAGDIVAGGKAYHVLPGQTKTYMVMAKPGHVLSVASMLAATNDGFTGVSNMKLDGSEPMSMDLMAYDAGTEENTERKSDTPAPAMGMGHKAARERVRPHPGFMGKGDLDKAMFGWDGPVGRITVTKKAMEDMPMGDKPMGEKMDDKPAMPK